MSIYYYTYLELMRTLLTLDPESDEAEGIRTQIDTAWSKCNFLDKIAINTRKYVK